MGDQSEILFPSLTSSAVQVRWRVPTAFPACPEEFTDGGLLLYASRLPFGVIFAQSQYSTSLVVHHHLQEDDFLVLTRFAGEAVKYWAVAHISILGGHFLHRSEGTFFSLQGAMKQFCKLTGEPLQESIDDYC